MTMSSNASAEWERFSFCILEFLSLACLFCLFYVQRNFVLISINPIAQVLFYTIVHINGAYLPS